MEWKRLARVPNPWVGTIDATSSRYLALTFDDGPHPTQTPLLLRLLDARGATATFFVLLTRARQHPELLDSMRAGGHEIGLHGPDHLDPTWFSHRQMLRRTLDARHDLEDLTQRPVRWFRPPYGRQTVSTALAVRRAGLTTVLWSATARDWLNEPVEERRRSVRRTARPGAILLAHDGFAGRIDGVDDGVPAVNDRAAWIEQLLDDFDERGLQYTSVGRALEAGRPVRSLRLTLKHRGRHPRVEPNEPVAGDPGDGERAGSVADAESARRSRTR